MKWIRFIPSQRERIVDWLVNFKTVLAVHAAQLKLDPERVAEITAFIDSMVDSGNDVLTNKMKYEASRDEFRQKSRQIFNEQSGLGSFIAEIRAKRDYNDGIGAQLGIVGHFSPINYLEYKPRLRAIIRGADNIELRFKRYYSDGVAIYSKRGEEEYFSLLATTARSPYYDVRPNIQRGVPEIRQYRIVLVKDEREVSRESDIVELKVWNPD